MRVWTVVGIAAVLVIAVLAVVVGPRPEPEVRDGGRPTVIDSAPGRVERLGELPRPIRESSGVVVSHRQPGVLWSHNDSGHDPVVYAVAVSGRILARFEVEDARARDWEDIASGPCPDRPDASCLYLADTGDNALRHRTYRVYVIEEPLLTGDEDPERARPVPRVGRVRYRYPDGARDTEALAVSPDGGLVLVNKGRVGRIDFFGVPGDTVRWAVRRDERVGATWLAAFPLEPAREVGRVVTGAALNAAGDRLAVRTYTELFVFRWPPAAEGVVAIATCFIGDLALGGEAVDFVDDTTFLVTSERDRGVPGAIDRLTCGVI